MDRLRKRAGIEAKAGEQVVLYSNRHTYRPVSPKDPAVQRLAELIRQFGILEPIVITSDGFNISGQRRWKGAKIAGRKRVPVRAFAVNHDHQPARFLQLLCTFNGYRNKGRTNCSAKKLSLAIQRTPVN